MFYWADPLSIAISPSGSLALACALDRVDHTQLAGKPALFKLQPAGTEMDVNKEVKNDSHTIGSDSPQREKGGAAVILQLSRALVEGLVQRKSVRDILLTADRLNEGECPLFIV